MLSKGLLFLSFSTLLFSNNLRASEMEVAASRFENLMNCIKKVPLDVEQYKGINSQQILFLAVMKNINNDSKPIENLDIDIDFSKLYQLVKGSCSIELSQVEELTAIEQG